MIDAVLMVWFALTALSTIYVAWDAFTRNPEMRVMKWGWILVTLYTGVIGAAVYVLSCQEPSEGAHEAFIEPLWKQALGSTIHCLAGDATGIIVAAAVTMALGLPMGFDVIVEYAFGFAFGLLIFQALFMREMLGGSYGLAVRRSFLPEWLSMNAVMAGMIPVMTVLMTRDMTAMEPASLRFWGVMSLSTLVGAVVAYPVNVWLVARGLKHGMGTVRALGRGGARVVGATTAMGLMTMPMPDQQAPPATVPLVPIARPLAQAVQEAPRLDAARTHATGANAHGVGAVPASPRSTPTAAQLSAVSVLTLVALGAGLLIAALFGDLAMRPGMPGATREAPMRMPMG